LGSSRPGGERLDELKIMPQEALSISAGGLAQVKEHRNGLMNESEIDLILASASPRRKDLLNEIGVRFSVQPSGVDEIGINGEPPEAQVCRLARAKAREIADRFPNTWVLGADTIVVIDGQILGKPESEEEARSMLRKLSSRTHIVFTGYALINSGLPNAERVRFVRSEVHIRSLTDKEIADYTATGEPMDKAGAYAIQGIGAGIVERISGSYTNVVGLPLCEVTRDLKDLGVLDFLAIAHDSAKH
jgi:septum formation protein